MYPSLSLAGFILALSFSTSVLCAKTSTKSAPPTPRELTSKLKTSLAQVRPGCVSVFAEGYGSGVIISPDGLVLTAAHMMRSIKDDTNFKIHLEDGREAKAKLLGFNRETDLALLKITDPSKTPWPYCELAKTTSTTGEFCFTMAHPSGRLKGRPAQVRLGRITTHSIKRNKPFFLFADCNIQPGDSGGPLFSMDGKLIGIDSSAASILGFNIFPAIDQYYLDRSRLLKKERWGNIELAPDKPNFTKATLNKEILAEIQKELMHRLEIQYPPTVDFIMSLKNTNGEVELDQQAMVDHMPRDVIAIARKQPLSLGLDDPEITRQLLPLPNNAVRPVPLYHEDKRFGNGIAIDPHHILTKASLLTGNKPITIQSNKKSYSLKRVAKDETWDLALLEVDESIKLPAIHWPESKVKSVQAGDLLKAIDFRQRMIWNVATDQARAVTKKRSIGPLKDKSIISKHRAPYPLAIRHALTLTATDAGTPVFNQDGEFIGMHIARFSRTMGLIIPAKQLREQSAKMLTSLEENKESPQTNPDTTK